MKNIFKLSLFVLFSFFSSCSADDTPEGHQRPLIDEENSVTVKSPEQAKRLLFENKKPEAEKGKSRK